MPRRNISINRDLATGSNPSQSPSSHQTRKIGITLDAGFSQKETGQAKEDFKNFTYIKCPVNKK